MQINVFDGQADIIRLAIQFAVAAVKYQAGDDRDDKAYSDLHKRLVAVMAEPAGDGSCSEGDRLAWIADGPGAIDSVAAVLPCTIFPGRYMDWDMGTWWYALPVLPADVPAGAFSDANDSSHHDWFIAQSSSKEPLGMGTTPLEAHESLRRSLANRIAKAAHV